MTYLKSVYLMGNKKVFDVQAIDLEQYARSETTHCYKAPAFGVWDLLGKKIIKSCV